MSEQQFGWNYFENEVVIRDKQDKKRMIVLVFSNFMCIPYNRKSFDELVDLLNEQQATISDLKEENEYYKNSKYENLVTAITKAIEDLYRTEEVYLADFDIWKRITEYEMELLDNGK